MEIIYSQNFFDFHLIFFKVFHYDLITLRPILPSYFTVLLLQALWLMTSQNRSRTEYWDSKLSWRIWVCSNDELGSDLLFWSPCSPTRTCDIEPEGSWILLWCDRTTPRRWIWTAGLTDGDPAAYTYNSPNSPAMWKKLWRSEQAFVMPSTSILSYNNITYPCYTYNKYNKRLWNVQLLLNIS